MIKLFMKNKIIEIANMFYNNKGRLVAFSFFITCFILLFSIAYLLGFLIPYLDFPPFSNARLLPDGTISFMDHIGAGFTILWSIFLTMLVGYWSQLGIRKFIRWIIGNISMAKHGVEVKPDWK